MLLLRFILIQTLFLATHANGQRSFNVSRLVGKTFVSRRLAYLEILNDTTLYSSINSYNDPAKLFLRNDTLFIKERWVQRDQTATKWMERLYDYKVLTLCDDTLRLKNNFQFTNKPANWEDTLFFVNIEKLKEPVTAFKYLKLDYSSPWSGTKKITVDSLGNVTFLDIPIPYSMDHPAADKNAKPKNIKGKFTQNEFTNFKNLLSKSLPSRLPFKRGCPLDGATSNFEILLGKNKIISRGCNLSWTHAFLLNYLYNIDQNKGLKKAK
jgi:hypothetical protein